MLAVASWLIFGKSGFVRYLTNDLLLAVSFAWLVLHGARGFSGAIARIFDFGAVQYVGRISTGIYVLHNYPPDIINKYVGPMPKLMAAPIVVVVMFGICSLSRHFIEQPLMNLKRLFREERRITNPVLAGAEIHQIVR